MRIVLDLQACQAASSKHRGIGRYSLALAKAIARQAGSHEVMLALSGHFPDGVTDLRAEFHGLVPQDRIRVFDLPGPLSEAAPQNAWRIRAAECVREHYLASLRPDVVHISSLFEGLGEDASASCLHGTGSFDTAITLYDLIPLARKDVYLSSPTVARWYHRKLQSLKNAELLLAISGFSRVDAIDALQLAPERVVNISSAVGPEFHPRAIDPDTRAALYARLGLRGEFIMYTGGIDFRKNIEGLIEAYARLPGALRTRYQLAVVCSIRPEDRVRLESIAAKNGLGKGDLILTGFVSDEDLVSLYNLTSLFVFPSLLEGFGLPALEAMSCGAATIGSDSSSIPEVIGRADALFDPANLGDITAKMTDVLTDPAFAADLRAHGLEQAKLFSWDASAKVAIAAFEETHARNAPGRVLVPVDHPRPRRRPRMAFVSPLPPERSGIADYSAELLPELARYYDIDVVLDQEKLSDTWADSNFAQRTVAWFDANAHQYERIVYHFGNSSFHLHMFGLLERHPGVVVMHDFFMSGVQHYAAHAGRIPNQYSRVLYDAHGYHALIDEQRRGRPESLITYPCNKVLLEGALGMIVHSEFSKTLAEKWYGQGAADGWATIPLLRCLPGRIDRRGARRALGLADDDYLIVSFGHLDPGKCNDRIVEAWLASPLAADPRCHLVFVGQNNGLQWGHDLLARIAVNPRIRITGFVSQETYRHYQSAADCAIQLRTQSRGETSAAIYDCLGYGLPTIINAHGTAAEVPDEVCVKLDDAFTDTALAQAMARLRDGPELAASLAERAGRYMRAAHHPAKIGERYRDTVERLYEQGPGVDYRRMLDTLAGLDAQGASDSDLASVAACIAANGRRVGFPHLLVDVSDLAAGRPASDTERALLLDLLTNPPPGARVEPVRLVDGQYRYARGFTLALIDRADLAFDDAPVELRHDDRMLLLGGAQAAPQLAVRGVQVSHIDSFGAADAR